MVTVFEQRRFPVEPRALHLRYTVQWVPVYGPWGAEIRWAPFDARGIAGKLRAVQVRLGIVGIGFEYSVN